MTQSARSLVRESAGTPSQWLSAGESFFYCQSTRAASGLTCQLAKGQQQLLLPAAARRGHSFLSASCAHGPAELEKLGPWAGPLLKLPTLDVIWANRNVTQKARTQVTERHWVCQSTRAASGLTYQQPPATVCQWQEHKLQHRQVLCNSIYPQYMLLVMQLSILVIWCRMKCLQPGYIQPLWYSFPKVST